MSIIGLYLRHETIGSYFLRFGRAAQQIPMSGGKYAYPTAIRRIARLTQGEIPSTEFPLVAIYKEFDNPEPSYTKYTFIIH